MERCHQCDERARLVRETREVCIGSRATEVEHEFYRCDACDEEWFAPGQMDAVMRRASDRIREEEGLLKPDEIRAIRERYGLSQAKFERLLGAGQKTVIRWEKGTVFQSKTTDSLLRLLAANDDNARVLGRHRGVTGLRSA